MFALKQRKKKRKTMHFISSFLFFKIFLIINIKIKSKSQYLNCVEFVVEIMQRKNKPPCLISTLLVNHTEFWSQKLQITKILQDIPKEEYKKCFDKWLERMQLCKENKNKILNIKLNKFKKMYYTLFFIFKFYELTWRSK